MSSGAGHVLHVFCVLGHGTKTEQHRQVPDGDYCAQMLLHSDDVVIYIKSCVIYHNMSFTTHHSLCTSSPNIEGNVVDDATIA